MSNPTTMPDIKQGITVKAPIEKVWEAVATAEGLSAWFMPNDFQPVVGHEFHLDAGPYGQSPCKVTEVDKPSRVSFDWAKDWHITIELKDLGDETEVTLFHSGWDSEKVTEFGESHVIVRDRMDEGWAGLVKKLARQLEA